MADDANYLSRRNWLGLVSTASLGSGMLAQKAFGAAPPQPSANADNTLGARIYNIREFGAVGDGKTLDCRAVQQVFHRETRQLLVSLVVRPAADGKTGAMVVTLPLGLNLTEPITVKVDNGPPERQAIQTCTNVGCFVAMTVTDKLVAAMRTGSELKITVQDANKKPVEMSLPLLGFGLAFDKAK